MPKGDTEGPAPVQGRTPALAPTSNGPAPDTSAPDTSAPDTSADVPSDATSPEAQSPRATDPRLLELLVCPLTRTRLSFDRRRGELVSPAARLAFPIVEGVPLLTAGAARELSDAELARLRKSPRDR